MSTLTPRITGSVESTGPHLHGRHGKVSEPLPEGACAVVVLEHEQVASAVRVGHPHPDGAEERRARLEHPPSRVGYVEVPSGHQHPKWSEARVPEDHGHTSSVTAHHDRVEVADDGEQNVDGGIGGREVRRPRLPGTAAREPLL